MQVVSVEVLAALDSLLWLRTGDCAAAHLRCFQSTVSRHSRRCLQVFDLGMEKRAGEWWLKEDQPGLKLSATPLLQYCLIKSSNPVVAIDPVLTRGLLFRM